MKEFLKNFADRKIYLLLAAVVLFITAFVLNRYVLGTSSANFYTRKIQAEIQLKEKDFAQLTTDTVLLASLINKTYDEEILSEVLDTKKGYLFFIYKSDTVKAPNLVFWNTQIAVPPFNLLEESDASRMVRLSNGLYVNTSKSVQLSDGSRYVIEALIPVMWRYFVEIENLRKEFVSYPKATARVDIVFEPTEYAIKSSFGNVLFYLQKLTINEHQSPWWLIGMIITGVLLVFVYVHQTAHILYKNYGLGPSAFFLIITLLLCRIITYQFPDLINLKQFQLFDPAIYASSYVLSSLGDLLLNSLLLCWVVLFFSRRLPAFTVRKTQYPWLNMVLVIFLMFILVTCTFIFTQILQSLVADGQISFNVTNFFSLTAYSFTGFLILAILALSYFFLSQIILSFAKIFNEGQWYILLLIIASIGLIILSVTKTPTVVEINLFALVWLLLYIWVMLQKVFSNINFRLNVSEVLFWLFVFSFSIAGVIIFENRKIEFEQRLRFAENLSVQADPASERLLSIALTYFDNDFLAPNFARLRDPIENKQIKDSLINKNFSEYLNKFDTKIYTFDNGPVPSALFNEDPISFDTLNTIHRIKGKKTSIIGLHYFARSFDKSSYIFKREIVDTAGYTIGYFFVLSDPKKYKSDALIPELFKQTKELVPEYSPVYSYAIYDRYALIDHYNDYPFPTYLDSTKVARAEYVQKQVKDYEELWYRYKGDKIVIIAKKDNSFIEGITLFAYLFSTFLLLLSVYRLMALLIRSRLQLSVLRQYWQLSIRSQIHSTIIFVSLLSFVVIGVATILFFINRHDRNNQDRLSRTMQIMVNEVEGDFSATDNLDNSIALFESDDADEVEYLMQTIADIHGTDVNLYDTSGNLRVSSNPVIYTKGVLSSRMNPMAYFYLNRKSSVQYVGEEQMGKVDYFSIYCPVRNDAGIAYAYLNIPFFSTQEELKQEISNFLVTVINLNAFIFLVAGAIALFITNRITSSFTIIGQKMRDINLQKINQEIQWKRRDEIGELVKEYNKMVHKLDESAVAMAKTEREGAWRQMARQVAHEIKNPLTPMKLSIQYLQKAIDNNSPNVKDMTGSVARTLIEQIDHLSKIASDFSQFANIGNPRNEVFDLHEMLSSLESLYESTDNLQMEYIPVSEKVMLFADKTQLNRLFTNLIQNAIEASDSDDERVIRVEEALNGENIIVSITDYGEGVPVHMRDKIFTPNFTTKSSGTGLGLAMSKSIAEQAQGDIWFITEENVGTTFFVKLPLLRAY